MTTAAEMVALYGDGSQDGILGKLIEGGFASLGGHHGGSGWKDVDGRLCFVDHWGGAWSMPQGEEKSAKECARLARKAGAVSLTDVVNAAARCQR